MKVTIDLSDEEQVDVMRIITAKDAQLALYEFRQWLRSEYKYMEHPKEVVEFIDKARERLYDNFEIREAQIWLD